MVDVAPAAESTKLYQADGPSPFELVTQNLLSLGALSVDRFLNAPSTEIDDIDISYHLQNFAPPPPASPPRARTPPNSAAMPPKKTSTEDNPALRMQTVSLLHQTCQRVFGTRYSITYEYLEEDGPNSKQCILTIARHNGVARSYKTEPKYSRKNDAKVAVAALAVEMGALDFIISGEPEAPKTKGLVLAPLDAPGTSDAAEPPAAIVEDDSAINEIEDCCKEWRAGRVKPEWFNLLEPKYGNKHGSALRIQLSPHLQRVYSSEVAYSTVFEAKKTCAKIALEQGVLDFIKFGNGQTKPAIPDPVEQEEEGPKEAEASPTAFITLQSFYESLPRPFPQFFGDKTAVEINATAWLNTAIQSARGGKLLSNFVWIVDTTTGLHGCLLRLDRPSESKTYLVDAKFKKRADAKSAVCLQAISQGIADYIGFITLEVESKVTPAMRKLAIERLFPAIAAECSKIAAGVCPLYTYERERDAFGCTLKVDIGSDTFREYTVSTDYRTKADAKVAVACLAVQQGAIEALRFRGEPVPAGYIPSLLLQCEDVTMKDPSQKRKLQSDNEQDEPDQKKRRTGDIGDKSEPGEITGDQDDQAAAPRAPHGLPSRPHASTNAGNKQPVASGSGSAGTGGTHARRPPGQFRPGPRYTGNAPMSYGHGSQVGYYGNPGSGVPMAGGNTGPYTYPADGRFAGQVPPPADQSYGGVAYTSPMYPSQYEGYMQPTPQPPHAQPYIAQNSYGSYPTQYAQYGHAAGYGAYTAYNASASSAGVPFAGGYQPSFYPSNQSGKQHSPHVYPPQSSQPALIQPKATPPNKPAIKPSPKPPVPNGGKPPNPNLGAGPSKAAVDSQKIATAAAVPQPTKTPAGGKPITAPAKSHVTALLDFCMKENITRPQFHDEVVTDDKGKTGYKVWVISGSERLELPVTFQSVTEGRERVAKQVLNRMVLTHLRTKAKESKEKKT